jgi:2-C-methyl-D-erythritol 2,4-cyclodiphosphate synthase
VNVRVGFGFDIHPFGDGGPLVLGGVTLEGPGLVGHSDADAVAHAVADALLGPSGLPDLGTLFPASDDRWRGVNSMDLLADVAARVHEAGWVVGNVDLVIAAEQPRLGPHTDLMAVNIAAVLAAPGDEPPHVSVRAKRGEGVGALGRGEGIAVWCVALLHTHA